jgi:isoquinoline 1-oxidoreductase beta subunit
VEKVVQVPSGVAVVARDTWSAQRGREALQVEWDLGSGAAVDTDRLLATYRDLARTPGAVALEKGDADAALARAARRLEAEFDVPYLAHAPMEPLNCTVRIEGDRCEIWTGTQFQTLEQATAARIAGVPPEHVTVHTTFLGGGFGRRANPRADFVSEAVHVAKAAGVPVKVVWTREDDIRGGFYRPLFVHRVEVGANRAGLPVAWKHTIVGQSILAGTPFEAMVKNGIDEASVEGVVDSPYLDGVPARRVTLHSPRNEVPVLWWRSVGNTHTAFVMESMLDELARAAGKDPLAFRAALLARHPRHLGAPRHLRRRLRARGEPARRRGPGPGEHRLRPRPRPEERDHHPGGKGPAEQLPRLRGTRFGRDARGRGPHREERREDGRRRRARHRPHRPGGGERRLRPHREAAPLPAAPARVGRAPSAPTRAW